MSGHALTDAELGVTLGCCDCPICVRASIADTLYSGLATAPDAQPKIYFTFPVLMDDHRSQRAMLAQRWGIA